jgi:hypothetical protein
VPFQEWWKSLNPDDQLLATSILTVILKNIPELMSDDYRGLAQWILTSQVAIAGNEQESFGDEFAKRCEPLFDYFHEFFSKDKVSSQEEMLERIEAESKSTIEVKAGILGLMLKQSNTLLNLAELAKKVMQGSVADHEGDLKKL